MGFPERKEAFDDPTCDTARAILRQAPTARTAVRRRLATLADAIRPGGRRRLGETQARRIQEVAQETIAPHEMDEHMPLQVGLLTQQYDVLAKHIELAQDRVASLLNSGLALSLQTI